jgi:hypothetical protein
MRTANVSAAPATTAPHPDAGISRHVLAIRIGKSRTASLLQGMYELAYAEQERLVLASGPQWDLQTL